MDKKDRNITVFKQDFEGKIASEACRLIKFEKIYGAIYYICIIYALVSGH